MSWLVIEEKVIKNQLLIIGAFLNSLTVIIYDYMTPGYTLVNWDAVYI